MSRLGAHLSRGRSAPAAPRPPTAGRPPLDRPTPSGRTLHSALHGDAAATAAGWLISTIRSTTANAAACSPASSRQPARLDRRRRQRGTVCHGQHALHQQRYSPVTATCGGCRSQGFDPLPARFAAVDSADCCCAAGECGAAVALDDAEPSCDMTPLRGALAAGSTIVLLCYLPGSLHAATTASVHEEVSSQHVA